MIKKIVSAFASFALLAAFAVPVSSEVNFEKDFMYSEEDGSVTIVKYKGSDAEVIVPNEIDGKLVVKIGQNAFISCYTIVSAEIPDSVTEIGSKAFAHCISLKTIEIPDSVVSIDVFT